MRRVSTSRSSRWSPMAEQHGPHPQDASTCSCLSPCYSTPGLLAHLEKHLGTAWVDQYVERMEYPTDWRDR